MKEEVPTKEVRICLMSSLGRSVNLAMTTERLCICRGEQKVVDGLCGIYIYKRRNETAFYCNKNILQPLLV